MPPLLEHSAFLKKLAEDLMWPKKRRLVDSDEVEGNLLKLRRFDDEEKYLRETRVSSVTKKRLMQGFLSRFDGNFHP